MSSDTTNTILLVEDEAILSLAEARRIRAFGYEVITTASGESAVEIALSNPQVRLVLMDIDLGAGIDGTEAARRILKGRLLPIVFLTSHIEREFVDRVKSITRYGYVIKSANDFVLRSSIEMAFELFTAHQATRKKQALLERAELIAHFGSWEYHVDDETFYGSPGARVLYGMDPTGTLDTCLVRGTPLPEYRPVLDDALDSAIRKHCSYDLEFDIRRQNDGEIRRIHSVGEFDPERGSMIGTIHDVTARRNAEERTSLALERLDLAVRAADMGIWDWDLGTGRLVWSEQMCRLLGVPGDGQADYQTWIGLMHPEDRDRADAHVKAALQKDQPYREEFRIVLSDGSIRWLRDAGRVLRDAQGQPTRMIGVSYDVSERHRD